MNWLITGDGRILNLSMVRQFVPIQEENWKILCWFLEGEEPDEVGGTFKTRGDAINYLVHIIEKCGGKVYQPLYSQLEGDYELWLAQQGLDIPEEEMDTLPDNGEGKVSRLNTEEVIANMVSMMMRFLETNELGNPGRERIETLARSLYARAVKTKK